MVDNLRTPLLAVNIATTALQAGQTVEEEEEDVKHNREEKPQIDLSPQEALRSASSHEDKLQVVQNQKQLYYKQRSEEGGRVPLFVDGKIKLISNVDVVDEQFTVRFHIYLGLPITVEEKNWIEACKSNDEKVAFAPKISIMNRASGDNPTFQDKKISKVGVRYDTGVTEMEDKYKFIYRYQQDYNVTCFEEMELKNFPFDCQDLSIDMRCEDNTYHMTNTSWVLDEEEKKSDTCSVQEGKSWFSMDVNNMCLKDFEVPEGSGLVCEFLEDGKKASKSGKSHSHFVIRIKLRRNFLFYFWNFFLTNGLLSASACACFAFDHDSDGLGDRYSILFTLLLTIMASKFVISDQVPKLPYNTLLDWYIMLNFLYIMLMTLLQTPFSRIQSDDGADLYDKVLMGVMIFILAMGHIIYGVIGNYARRSEKKKLVACSEQLKKLGVKTDEIVKIRSKMFQLEEQNYSDDEKSAKKGDAGQDENDKRTIKVFRAGNKTKPIHRLLE